MRILYNQYGFKSHVNRIDNFARMYEVIKRVLSNFCTGKFIFKYDFSFNTANLALHMVFDRLLCPVIAFLRELIKVEQSSGVCHLVAAAIDSVLMSTSLARH